MSTDQEVKCKVTEKSNWLSDKHDEHYIFTFKVALQSEEFIIFKLYRCLILSVQNRI